MPITWSCAGKGERTPPKGETRMCGIVAWSGAVEPGRLAEAVRRLAHRGPDDEGLWWRQRPSCSTGPVGRRDVVTDGESF
jgi:hypothetical protein